MKLLVIILCLLSERFLIHGIAHRRFNWFADYQNKALSIKPNNNFFNHYAVQWLWIIFPLLLCIGLLVLVFSTWVWGLLGFFLNLVIFYYCLGPDNAFYPPAAELLKDDRSPAQPYFENVNNQLFTPIFWYLILGPFILFFYRLNEQVDTSRPYGILSQKIALLMEWIPARLAALCYLLAGHFQNGFTVFKPIFLSDLNHNRILLGETGMAAARNNEDAVNLPQAEVLVEQALIIYLAGFSFLLIAVWL